MALHETQRIVVGKPGPYCALQELLCKLQAILAIKNAVFGHKAK